MDSVGVVVCIRIVCGVMYVFEGVTARDEGSMRVRWYQVFISFWDRWVPVTVANKGQVILHQGIKGSAGKVARNDSRDWEAR